MTVNSHSAHGSLTVELQLRVVRGEGHLRGLRDERVIHEIAAHQVVRVTQSALPRLLAIEQQTWVLDAAHGQNVELCADGEAQPVEAGCLHCRDMPAVRIGFDVDSVRV